MNRRVEQKLHLASQSLSAINTSANAEVALIEAAIFHLYVAYRAYLRELIDQTKIAPDIDRMSVNSARDAQELLQTNQLHSTDINELAKMEQSGSWPEQLLKAYAAAANEKVALDAVANAGIPLHDITAKINAERLADWLQNFRALLHRQREHAQEW